MKMALSDFALRKKGIYGILHVIILLLSLFLVISISIDTFKGIPFYTQSVYMKVQLWICVLFLFDFILELFLSKNTFSPMGVMDISAPRVKNIIPAMTITAPTRKHSRILEVMGAMVKLNTITIPTTGRTAFKDSANFCRIFGFNNFNIGLSFL